MRVLVTGANGFVGRALVPLLAERGHHVRAAVRKAGTVVPDAAETVAIGDIGPDTDWHRALDGIDAVAHLAARVHVMKDTAADPLAAFRAVNTDGTRRLAEQAAASGVRRFVYLSSIKALVDESQPRPLDEATPADPHSPYGVSKLEAEQALAGIAADSGLEVAVIRPPLVYGPGVAGNFRSLLKLVASGLPLPLGGLDNRRSLIFVGNLADAAALCLTHPGASGGHFLVHDGQPLSTAELVRAIGTAIGRPARLVPLPAGLLALGARLAGKQAVYDRIAGSLTIDDRAIRDRLGWRPPHDPASGLRATAEWFKASRG
ncbi:UDP-glucose 4-epimerase family protein [Azospirillum agricola]|uniref:UDP-glucose 4-epimerase family protein n=1 Tax=Azospirillum agricola TaxID=1720247 RepID=UPI000A0EF8D7|nr:SDR family oxidoreductase [Azospirillum agricola]SMH57902.1 Nucleoside-diphosphate-sugar epimerase [Azospirillum lipoferum]